MQAQAGKYLTFLLNNEEYGISIQKVREIIGLQEITPIPRTPGFIKGVINLRGKIIPIFDLRLRFGLEERAYNERTCIIVVEVLMSEVQRQIGLVVDTVSEVMPFQSQDIEATPQFGMEIETDFLTGIGKTKEKVVMLLNIDHLLNKEETAFIKEMRGSAEG